MPRSARRPESAVGALKFSTGVIEWQRAHGRHDLPWQNTRDAYRVWLSEIMLQQTQVTAVIPYFARFLDQFPDLESLASAEIDEVMACWSGLGYYSRARNLHACAQRVAAEFGGRFPHDPEILASLPGIGRSTAAAIAVFAYGTRAAILDGNVKRVLARWLGIEGWPGLPTIERALWVQAQALLPDDSASIEAYTQGLMDLGATVCTRGTPKCGLCPVAANCVAHRDGLTAVLPTPKPGKTLPLRRAHMLVAIRAGEVLVEKRPASGIWGGLWSLPEFDTLEALQTCAAALAPGIEQEILAERQHGFTHFTLKFIAHCVQVKARPMRVEAPGAIWLALNDVATAALPAPIKKLLLEIGPSKAGRFEGRRPRKQTAR